MRIGFLAAFAGRNCGGPEVFERETIRAIRAAAPEHDIQVFCLDRRGPGVVGIPRGEVTYHVMQPQIRALSMVTHLPLSMLAARLDVFHALIVPPPFCLKRTIMAMPCSSLIRHPEFFPLLVRLRLRFLVHRAVPKAARIVCPSEHVRGVIMEHFRLSEDRLPVIHPGVSQRFRQIPEDEKREFVENRYQIRYPFFLFSGRWEPRKNVKGIIEAFALFKRTYPSDYRLVFTGGQSWQSKEMHAVIDRLGIRDAIVDLGKTPVDDLPYLYAAATALVYVSLWEGFGMPIVEAMSCGTPVITSNVSAMPETAGGAALLVEPKSTEEIASAMRRIVSDTALVDRLREQGLRHATKFSWDRTAREYLNVYETVTH
jgi:glycosyltransferase involved in cell wall biosynthesis